MERNGLEQLTNFQWRRQMKTLWTIIMGLAMVTCSFAQSAPHLTGEWRGGDYSYGYTEMTFFSVVNPSDREIEITTVLKNGFITSCKKYTIPEGGRIEFNSSDFNITGAGIVQMVTRVTGQQSLLNEAAHVAAWSGLGYCYQENPSIHSMAVPTCESLSPNIPMVPVLWTLYTKAEAMKISKMDCD
jgi:hypothetical protein